VLLIRSDRSGSETSRGDGTPIEPPPLVIVLDPALLFSIRVKAHADLDDPCDELKIA
jgi:hypothetical protein